MTQPPDRGLNLQVAADIHASLTGLRADLAGERARQLAAGQNLMPLRIPLQSMTLTGTSPNLTGTLDLPQVLGPSTGWVWQLDGAGAQGFTTGTVSMYLSSTADAEIVPFTSAGVFYQRKFRYLTHGERVVFSAASITGTVSVWLNGIAAAEKYAYLLY
jgi:hypothetical protein